MVLALMTEREESQKEFLTKNKNSYANNSYKTRSKGPGASRT